MTYPTLDVLRLEVQTPPTGLQNLVQNPSGELGGWAWITPVAGSTMAGATTTAPGQPLVYTSPGGVASWFLSEPIPIAAGRWAAASWLPLPQGSGYYRVRFQWLDAAQAVLSYATQTGYLTADGVSVPYGPYQAPASTAYVQLRVEHYSDQFAQNPTAGQKIYVRDVTVAEAATSAELGTVRRNLVPNPSFETVVTGWSAEGGAFTRTGSIAYVGGFCGQLTMSTDGTGVVKSDIIPVTPNETYSFSIRVRSGVVARSVSTVFAWYNGIDYIGGSTSGAAILDSTTAWSQVKKEGATAPPGADGFQVWVYFQGCVSGEYHFLDAAMVNVGVTAETYFDGNTADAEGWDYAWTGAANISASTATSSNLGFIEPVQYANILGPTHSIKVVREELSLGTLSAEILDAALDPATAVLIRPGRRVRLAALLSGVWEPVFTGKVSAAKVVYEPLRTDERTARITLEAVDNIAALAATSRPDGVATIDVLPFVLEGAGVPWNVNGSGDQVAAATVASVNVNASALDQVGVTRDTVRGYAWVDRRGVLQAWDAASMSRPGWTTTEADYTALRVDFDMDRCINTVLIKYLRYAAGETEEVPYGPYVDAASVAEWGPRRAEFTIHGGTESPAAMQAFADAVLAANGTPTRTVNEMVLPVVGASTLTRAKLDLYDAVTVTNTAAGITAQVVPVARVEHDISPGKWLVTLGFAKTGGVAPPQFTPPVQSAGDGWTAATLQNGWVNYGSGFASAKYRRLNGVVFVRGVVANGTNGGVILTLPAGYRPAESLIFATDVNPSVHARLDVGSNGQVVAPTASNNGYLSVSCCFVAEV